MFVMSVVKCASSWVWSLVWLN